MAQNQAHFKHGKDMDALAESAHQQEEKRVTAPTPASPVTRVGATGARGYNQQRESRRAVERAGSGKR